MTDALKPQCQRPGFALRGVVVAVVAVMVVAVMVLAGCGAEVTTLDQSSPAQPSQSASDASAGCSTTAPPPGRSTVTITSGGKSRTYSRYVPAQPSPRSPAPLVVDIPAYSPASQEEAFSGFTTHTATGRVPADDAGAIVVTPQPINGAGALRTWNYKNIPWWSDDQRFIADLLDDIESHTCINTARVLLTGFAVGAVFASILACTQTSRFTALATVSGLYSAQDCTPTTPLPVLAFHGTNDRFIPYPGGVGDDAARLGLSDETAGGMLFMAARPGAVSSMQAWATHNHCAPTPHTAPYTAGVTHTQFTGCTYPSSVEMYTIIGGAHTWPDSTGMTPLTPLLGPVTHTINATTTIWDFFTHTWH